MQIKKIESRHLNELFNLSVSKFKNESWTIQQFEDALKNNNYICYGVFEDDVLASYIIVLNSPDDLNILSIATKDEFLNKGYATTLISQIVDMANNTKTISLEVKEKNTEAYNLYTKLNFNVVAVRKNYYKDGSNALIMFYKFGNNIK